MFVIVSERKSLSWLVFVHRETKQREPARFETSKRRPASSLPQLDLACPEFLRILCDLAGLLQVQGKGRSKGNRQSVTC